VIKKRQADMNGCGAVSPVAMMAIMVNGKTGDFLHNPVPGYF